MKKNNSIKSNKILKNIVREQLEITSNKKKESLLAERILINERLSTILELSNYTNEKQKEKFFTKVFSEMVYFEENKNNKQLINEENKFWDMLGGIFGTAKDALSSSFKEFLAKLLIKYLTPMNPDGWFGQFISTTVGNIPLSDVGKLTDCRFLSKLFTKSIVETVLAKKQGDLNLTDGIYTLIRNGIIEVIDNISFAQKIEDGIANLICPAISRIKDKMSNLTDVAKQSVTGSITGLSKTEPIK